MITEMIVAGTLLVAASQTAPTCQSRDDMVEMLKQKYDEKPHYIGLRTNGHVVEVFMSDDRGSWTIVTTRPDGLSCISAVGKYWESLPDPIASPLA